MKRTAIKLEKLRYARWAGKKNRHTVQLRGRAYAVNMDGSYMLCLGRACYPKLKKTINNDVYFWGFKDLGSVKDKLSWQCAYRVLRRELKRIRQQGSTQ
ncbi:hypothetical protein P375_00325 [Gallibacterium genomosp. 2]|uniref:Uncharacterized protein n=2 Tax=Gallibacterium TaxID=155493 RepID=A0A0A2XR12_9PAST|nr:MULTISPECIES: hypothetical protein [Gallibacterium]KGQ28344.1 hypothetical protein JP32_12040 [Gallibacterium anatis]KGQ34628.1 hypothetical protein P375_00325 [Gallibacterium genomosp. 2]